MCVEGYERDYLAPGYAEPGNLAYLCVHNLLKSHAQIVNIYRNSGQKGKIGIAMDTFWFEPKTNSDSDAIAADQAYQFFVREKMEIYKFVVH